MKVGVIGLGSVGMRHVRNLRVLGHEVCGYDTVDAGIVPKMPTDMMETECHVVVIASPTDTHLDYLTQFVEARVPTLVEKPIADGNVLKVELVLSLANEENVPVFTGFNLRFHACVRRVKGWLQEGYIGKPLWAGFVVAQRNERPEYRRVGVSLNWLSHEVDLALYLLGQADFVTAVGNDKTLVDMELKHHSGTQTALHGDYLAEPEMRDFRIVGENGNITVNLVERWAKIDVRGYKDRYIAQDDWDENYLNEMAAFTNIGNPLTPSSATSLATGIDGLNALKLCLAAKERTGG